MIHVSFIIRIKIILESLKISRQNITCNQVGDEVHLGGQIGAKLKGLLTFVQASTAETDEVHIICEYPEGAEWAGQKAGRANRFIISPDISLETAKGPCACFSFVRTRYHSMAVKCDTNYHDVSLMSTALARGVVRKLT